MFECTLNDGEMFKKIVAALSDLVTEGNFMIDNSKISFQGMDSSHVSLVALSLRSIGFEPYRCDNDMTLGLNFSSLNKILKCMASKDKLNIRANEDSDSVFFTFVSTTDKRVSNFELKLMDIDSEQLGIPETEYSTSVRMPSSEFQRICRDLAAIGDSVVISTSKEGVRFSVSGDIGSGDMLLQGRMIRSQKKKQNENENENENQNQNENENNEEEGKQNEDNNNNDNNNDVQKENKVKNEKSKDIDGDQSMDLTEDTKNNEVATKKGDEMDEDEDDDNQDDDIEEYPDNADDDEKNQIVIQLNEPVNQTFALRYLNNFTKATNLSSQVTLSMGAEVPLMVEYRMGNIGSIRYYLAPKIDDEE